jgi:NitT/TauT family transport system ATP-binding protein
VSGLVVENLSNTYRMKRTGQSVLALDDISFSAETGEFLAILGPTGCGKTSILSALAGIIPEWRGRMSFDGKSIEGPGRDRAQVFQAPSLFPWRNVVRNISYGLDAQGMKRKAAREDARRFVDLVGLSGFEESLPGELSGGMQHRVNLARALAVQSLDQE